MATKTEFFLGFTIINNGNGDGWILTGRTPTEMAQRHLGSFTHLETAKHYALVMFMIFRPQHFAKNIASRVITSYGHAYDFDKLAKVLAWEGVEMPSCITPSNDSNRTIQIFGKKLSFN
jgi:hypothetical protein